METWMWTIWLAVFVITLIIESIGTDLISVWFSFGALVALIISLIPDVPWWVEAIVFTVLSIVSLLCLRPLVHKFLKKDVLNSNIDEMKGKRGILTKGITPLEAGEARIGDVLWTAIAQDGKISIEQGRIIVVLSVSGNKLVVKEDVSQKEAE
ncbi:MAG: NfeD family protein [Bacilli bacterium]